jgi:hypothetical protein
MHTLRDEINSELERDLISFGWLKQSIRQTDEDDWSVRSKIASILFDMVSSGEVRLGTAIEAGGRVRFIAWRGDPASLVKRAFVAVETATPVDRDFSVWLCRADKIDCEE